MYKNQIGQKKKKQAVRRLSQSSGGHGNRREDIRRKLEARKRLGASDGMNERSLPRGSLRKGRMEEDSKTRPFASGIKRNFGLVQTETKRHVSPLANTILTQGSANGSPSKQETTNIFTKKAVSAESKKDDKSKQENIFQRTLLKSSPTQGDNPGIFQSKNPATAVMKPQQETQNIFGSKLNNPTQGIFSATKQFKTKTSTLNNNPRKYYPSPLAGLMNTANNVGGSIVSGLSHQADVEIGNVATVGKQENNTTQSSSGFQELPGNIFQSAAASQMFASLEMTGQLPGSNGLAVINKGSIFGSTGLPQSSNQQTNTLNILRTSSSVTSSTTNLQNKPSIFGTSGLPTSVSTGSPNLITSQSSNSSILNAKPFSTSSSIFANAGLPPGSSNLTDKSSTFALSSNSSSQAVRVNSDSTQGSVFRNTGLTMTSTSNNVGVFTSPPSVASNPTSTNPGSIFGSAGKQSDSPSKAGVFTLNKSSSYSGAGSKSPFCIGNQISSKPTSIFGNACLSTTVSGHQKTPGIFSALSKQEPGPFSNKVPPPGISQLPNAGSTLGNVAQSSTFAFGSVFSNPGNAASGAGESSIFSQVQESNTQSTPRVFTMPVPGGKQSVFGSQIQESNSGGISTNQKQKVSPKSIKRSFSNQDISDLTSIVIKGLTQEFYDKKWLDEQFKIFGANKISFQPSKQSVVVSFDTHESARQAKSKAAELFPMKEVHVFWYKKKGTGRASKTTEKSPGSKKGSRSRRISISNALNSIDLSEFPPASSAQERFAILDEVDKRIRQAITPFRDIANAPVIIGVCCDMCPEKERYMREFQANLSIFEMVPGTQDNRDGDVPKVEHTKAIKEYSRSAADKLEPLGHELRPVHVLQMTLDYLMTNVMDNSEEKWGEWFNFLWNRTRAIRKDITQQHLCDLPSADLVEKITRFHIFCAHYLCEEDLHSFDPKINNENLTKCLQTLKQFYVDLSSDQEMKCPNEPEFQAYDILLNLNEGDTLRKAMQYRLEVRNSPEVKFALEVFSSLNSHNFVRFFKLLKSASYLNACIMHRYFTQVRRSALQIMTKAYSANESYPLQVLQELLAFEDKDGASRFCSHYNFTTTEDSVQFSKMSFTDPERAFPLQRANNVIESKRNCSIGEVVNGSPLAGHPIHEPLSSFDTNGRYIGLSNLAQMLSSAPDTPEPESPYEVYEPSVNVSFEQQSPVMASPADDLRLMFNKAIEGTCVDLLEQVVAELLKDISEGVVHQVLRLQHQLTEEFCNKFIDESLLVLVKQIVEECVEEEVEIKRRKIAIAESRRRMSVVVLHEIVEEFMQTELASLAGDAKRVISQQMKAQSFAKMSAVIMREMLEDVMNKQCEEIALTTRKEVVREKKAMLMKRTEVLHRNQMKKYFKIWSKEYQTRVHIRHILEEIPAKPPMLTVKQQLEKLLSTKDSTASVLTCPSSYTSVIKKREEFQKLLTDMVNEREMKRLRAMQPINLTRLHTELTASKLMSAKREESASSKYVKLVISFPNRVEHFSAENLESLIKFKLRAQNPDHCRLVPAELQGKFEQLSEIQETSTQSTEFKYDVKACYGILTDNELRKAQRHHLLLGLTGILFIFDSHDQGSDQVFWDSCQTRLRKILRSKPPVPRIPLVIMNINSGNSEKQSNLQEKLGIEEFRREGLLSECVVYEQPEPMDSDELHKQLVHAVLWLMSHCPKFPSLEQNSLKSFVEKEILKHFTIPLYEETAVRNKAFLQPQCPEVIVDLYNSVIDYVIAMVTNIKLRDISLPVSEFVTTDSPRASWNSAETFYRLRLILRKLKLPMPTPPATDGTWHSEYVLCLDYINVLLEEEPLKRIGFTLINRVERILGEYAKDSHDFSSTTLTAADFPWPQVIEACIKTLLSWLHTVSDGTEENVYYLPEDLDGFKQPLLWTEAVPETFKLVQETSAVRKKKRMESKLSYRTTQVEEELARIETSRPRLDVSERESFVEDSLQETARHFERNLGKEKRSWKRFEDELKSILDEQDSEDLSLTANGQGVKRKNPSWSVSFWSEKTNFKRNSAVGLEDVDLPDLNSTTSYFETSLNSLRNGLEFHRHLENLTERKLKEALEDNFG